MDSTPPSKSIFILSAQSNMVGRGGVHSRKWDAIIPTECEPHPFILRFSVSSSWDTAVEPLHTDIDDSNACGVGPGMPFATMLLPHLPPGSKKFVHVYINLLYLQWFQMIYPDQDCHPPWMERDLYILIAVCRKLICLLHKSVGELSAAELENLMTIVANLRQFKIPNWFLNRKKDYKDRRYSHVVSNVLNMKLRDNLERLKKISYAGVNGGFRGFEFKAL
ncbi:Ribosomal protein S13 protein [Dioscorea alata]|uniref:Ribosomal protein S13 protein n=1 Tax=Dioscorea alata TaxID=55571 RepID=A0ACB7UXI7_DIOAL|nr:Ribosomal protein S13 protein [Dioscorea alata]